MLKRAKKYYKNKKEVLKNKARNISIENYLKEYKKRLWKKQI